MNLYAWMRRLNDFILPRSPLNPKLAYSTLKATWRRGKLELFGIDYRPDPTSVNIVIDDVGLLLCSIPKVAGTSFTQELVYNRALGDRVALYSTYLGDLLVRRPALREYHKVAFVRNPWARAVSVYNSKICAPRPAYVRTFFIRYRGLRHGMPFEDFIEWLCKSDEGRDAVADRHWISQHRFLYAEGSLLVDRIARIESLNAEFDQICDDLGVARRRLGNYSLKTTEGGASYLQCYNDHTAALIARRYSRDIELFGYNFSHESNLRSQQYLPDRR